jgi:hypothetical protein
MEAGPAGIEYPFSGPATGFTNNKIRFPLLRKNLAWRSVVLEPSID